MSVIIRMRVSLCMEVSVTQKITAFELPETKTFTLSTEDQRSRSHIKMSPNWVIEHMSASARTKRQCTYSHYRGNAQKLQDSMAFYLPYTKKVEVVSPVS